MFDYSYTVMHRDDPVAHVKTDYETYLEYQDLTPVINLKLFMFEPKVEDIKQWISERCFPEARMDKKILLRILDVDHYDPILITKVTHGVMWEDYYWIKPDGENLTFKEVKLRD